MFLNFHTHSGEVSGSQAIRNLIWGREDPEVLQHTSSWFSVGIHPWYIDENEMEQQVEQMERFASLPGVKLIGECGLDRLKGTALDLQMKVFVAQIKLAEKLQKPVIIHCVKCFSELLELKKRLSPACPMIIHGFNNKPELGKQLLDAGFYFSIGTAILGTGSNAATFLLQIPDDKLFLETDASEIAVEEVYKAAAAIRNTTLNHLKDTIFASWMSLQNGASDAPSIKI